MGGASQFKASETLKSLFKILIADEITAKKQGLYFDGCQIGYNSKTGLFECFTHYHS
jgi:hypothetical protein